MFLIHGVERIKKGKSASRKLRKINNKIPSIIYGFQKPTIYLELDHDIIFNFQKNSDFYNSKIMIKVSEIKYVVMVKSVQHHCFKLKLLHIDFLHI